MSVSLTDADIAKGARDNALIRLIIEGAGIELDPHSCNRAGVAAMLEALAMLGNEEAIAFLHYSGREVPTLLKDYVPVEKPSVLTDMTIVTGPAVKIDWSKVGILIDDPHNSAAQLKPAAELVRDDDGA